MASFGLPSESESLAFRQEPTQTADIQPVPEPYAGNILTRTNLIVCNILVLLPPLLLLAGLGLIGYSFYSILTAENEQPDPLREQAPLLAGGLVMAGVAGYLMARHNAMFGNVYLLRVARAAFRSRPDSIVDADDPEAEFVEITPRENWKKFMLDTAADTGFLLLDSNARQIRFEGDHERYRIPAGAVRRTHVEEVYPFGVQAESDALFFVILDVQTGGGAREIPFTPRARLGMQTRAHREAWAVDMLDRLRRLVIGPSTATQATHRPHRPHTDRDLED